MPWVLHSFVYRVLHKCMYKTVIIHVKHNSPSHIGRGIDFSIKSYRTSQRERQRVVLITAFKSFLQQGHTLI